MARIHHTDAIRTIYTAADIRDEITFGWDDDDIAVLDDDADIECENPF